MRVFEGFCSSYSIVSRATVAHTQKHTAHTHRNGKTEQSEKAANERCTIDVSSIYHVRIHAPIHETNGLCIPSIHRRSHFPLTPSRSSFDHSCSIVAAALLCSVGLFGCAKIRDPSLEICMCAAFVLCFDRWNDPKMIFIVGFRLRPFIAESSIDRNWPIV